ncbi:hypothetical protein BC829DRAFT_391805 [Chytridium lagenaria]|nr:hypothetical protein BC829DRAFT_391805 [Chytridium lagenaria]
MSKNPNTDTASILSTSSSSSFSSSSTSKSKVPKEKVQRRIIQYSIIAGLTVFLAVVVIVVGWFNIQEGNTRNSRTGSTFGLSKFNASQTRFAVDNTLDQDVKDCFNKNYIFVRINVTTIDTLANSFKARVSFLPCGDYVMTTNTQGGLPMLKSDLNITFDQTSLFFKARSIMPASEVVLSFANNDVNSYPFDKYASSRLYILGNYLDPNTKSITRIPLGMTINGAIQGWNIRVPTMDDISRDENGSRTFDGTVLVLQVDIRRSGTAQFFSILVIVIMWVLVLLVAVATITIWWDWRKVEPPIIALAIALLFALPAIRSAQPGSTPIGSTADVVSFFWVMTLESFSCAAMLLNYIVMYKRDTKWAPKNA